MIYSFLRFFAQDTIVKNIFLQIASKCVYFVDKYTLFSYNHIQSYGLVIVNFFLKLQNPLIFRFRNTKQTARKQEDIWKSEPN